MPGKSKKGGGLKTKKSYMKKPNKKIDKKFHLIEAYKKLRDFKLHMDKAKIL